MFPRWIRLLIALIAFAAFISQASANDVIDHSFSFDTLKDGQDAEAGPLNILAVCNF